MAARDGAEAVDAAATFRLFLLACSGVLSSSWASKSEPLLDAATCGFNARDERDGRDALDEAALVASDDFLAGCLERFVAGMI